MSNEEHTSSWHGGKSIHLFLATLIAVAFIGFFVGTRSEDYEASGLSAIPEHQRPEKGDSKPAPSYAELLEEPLAANEHWTENIDELKQDRPDLFETVENTERELVATLSARAERRAYDGAPPTVPHPVKQLGDLACVACHTDGVKVRGRIARPMSHEFFANCTQCHAAEKTSVPIDPNLAHSVPVENSFEGLAPDVWGATAWAGAPPEMPHREFMRSECTSCHGGLGYEGMQTTHPWRQSCQQCHTRDAGLNQNLPPSTLPPIFD